MENEEKVVKLSIPDGYEFDRVEGGEVILKKKEAILFKTYEECCINMEYVSSVPSLIVPDSLCYAMMALGKLLICRDYWWEQLGWKPDWKESGVKYAIRVCGNVIKTCDTQLSNYILTFPTKEVRDQFLETFRDFIEEAKELL